MTINLNNKTEREIDNKKVNEIIKEIVKDFIENYSEKIINILITDDSEIEKFNRKYRNKEGPTDVLSFEYGLDEEVIGEIIISIDSIEKNAKELNETFDEEFYYILIHGVLHILGYDHIEDEEAREMDKLQDEYYNKLFRNRL